MPAHKKPGVLLINLGSPDSTRVSDVRKYLNNFLMDGKVLDIPYPIRRFIVGAFILPFRPKKSAEAYEKIWWKEGSPLIVINEIVKQKLQSELDFPVALGMRYGNPSIGAAVQELLDNQVEKVLLVPLYPQYAMSTFETVVEKTEQVLHKNVNSVELEIINSFYNDPDYIHALTESAKSYLETGYDHLLFSYHGVPERHIRKTDPTGTHCLSSPNCCSIPSAAHQYCYRHQCYVTTELFVEKASIPGDKYSVAFQSRLGRDPWLTPFTDQEIKRLAGTGVRTLAVICPAFVSDCLETLEEIGIRGKETFLEAGGEEFKLIPCLNDHPLWMNILKNWALNFSE